MITLNKDRGIESIDDCHKIAEIIGYVSEFTRDQGALKDVIGKYHCSFDIPCGLSECHTPHRKGYIVLSSSGVVTNIGKDCGKKYFGLEFETMSRRLENDLKEKDNRQRLSSLHDQIEEIEAQITQLFILDGGKDVHDRIIRLKHRDHCPEEIRSAFDRIAKDRSNAVLRTRNATAAELDAIEARTGTRPATPHYIEEMVCRISGVESLYPENNIQTILLSSNKEMLELLRQSNPDTTPQNTIVTLLKWGGSLESVFESASAAIAQGRLLLQAENLLPLAGLLRSNADRRRWQRHVHAVALA